MKQSFELLDTESGFKVSLETTNEVLSSDQLFKLPDVANTTYTSGLTYLTISLKK